MKLVITSNTSWFVYNFFRFSITEFLVDGNQVYVLAPEDKYSAYLKDLGCEFFDLKMSRSGVNAKQEIVTIKRINAVISALEPDCVLNFTPKLNIYSALVSRYRNIPVINSVAGLGAIFSEGGIKAKLGKKLLSFTQPLVDHVVFQNNDDWKVYLDHGYVSLTNSSRVRGIGINLKKFVPHEAPDDGVTRFVLVARMLKTKGVHEFVAAAQAVEEHYNVRRLAGIEVPRYQFSLLGFVDQKNPQGVPRELLQHWHDTTLVDYLGATDDVFSIVKDYDCVVLPSYYREGIPQCLIEAASMAKPIITTDNVGCRETVIDGQSGFLVKPQSVPELKEAMIKMIELGHQHRVRLGQRGRRKAETEFCHLEVSNHYLKVIEQVTKNRKTKLEPQPS
ncbi:glycosyltransferase family 4 protein [Vibrio astriarenae]|uniref:glycosyltransferase family 4 protein n=1 Tax=Vibrio astriarenae TaxID=1481923 RepID=UPI0037360C23